jgi:membrane protein YqaA with SNARE-associated domain
VFGWAAAEGVFWPLMPEAVLVPLSALRPRTWWQLALMAAAGSSVGVAASYRIGQAQGTDRMLETLPLVRPAMVEAARTWLATEGGRGLRHQPLSGLPIKVFALVAPSCGVSLPALLIWAALARGARFGVVCGAAACVGQIARRDLRRWPRACLAAWSGAFALGLWRTVIAWERRSTPTR